MITAAAPLPLPVPARGFVSCRSAATWEEGLICGNGTLGANALCRPLDERIIFSHERLFMPMGSPLVPADQSAHLPEIRGLINQGNYREACELQFARSGQTSFRYPDFFVPAFDLTINTRSQGQVRDYARSLDFRSGQAILHWADARGVFERRMFVSRKHGVAVLLLTGPQPGSLDCRLRLEPREPSSEFNDDSDIRMRSDDMFAEHFGDIASTADDASLTYSCRCLRAYPGSIQALEGHARVVAAGGLNQPQAEGALVISGADRIMVLVDIRLLKDAGKSQVAAMRESLAALPADFGELLEAHSRLHGELFDRVRLDLGGGAADHARATEELLELSTGDSLNRALVEKVFDAGRYNIISATGELPPNLQGVWGGGYVPAWAGDFTHNGNLPSAIASMLMGNLPELMLAYTSYIESLVPDLELNAKRLFGARGIILPSRSTTHGYNNALAPNFAGGMWVAGAAWAAHFFYDYYLYTGDRKFLAEHALPFMEKAAVFFADFLREGPDGKLLFSPTQSPENTPRNTNSQATFNATMDVAAAKELLGNIIAASRELGRNAGKIPAWENMLSRMPDYMIDQSGVIKEWLTPKLENNDEHRHSSHLYALYDDMPEEIISSGKLRAAFRKSIEQKLATHWRNNQRGFMSFGLVQLGQAATSLGEGELAYECLEHLANRFWLANLASTHNHRSLFNMDISGGMPAVIIKMLVASQPGRISLLPALPKAWPSGTLEGALCRGAITVERLHWDGRRIEVKLRPAREQEVTLALPASIDRMTDADGRPAGAAAGRPNERTIRLPAGRAISLDILLKTCGSGPQGDAVVGNRS